MAKTASKTGESSGTSEKPDSGGTRLPIDPLILIVIAAIAVIAIIAGIAYFQTPSSSQPVPTVSAQDCGERTLAYVNELLAGQGPTATLVSVEEKNGTYKVDVFGLYRQIPLYVTRDCTLLFFEEGMEMGAPLSGPTASTCGDRTLSFVNDLVSEGTAATLAGVWEKHGMYQVNVSYQGEEIPLYATMDCSLLFNIFMDRLDMTVPPPTLPPTPLPTPTPEPVKTDRPSVDLYVMSFCPYGTQAEATMKPVADLLGKRADIRLRYITTVTGTSVSSVRSLHGAVEVEEDLRQICIQKHAPGSIWTYLSRFNAECYPLTQNATVMRDCSQNVTASLGIDGGKIQTCATGTEGIGLLATDEESASENDATASPTLLINGVDYTGPRTPEAYKQAICGSFTSPPAECTTALSSQQAAVAGSC